VPRAQRTPATARAEGWASALRTTVTQNLICASELLGVTNAPVPGIRIDHDHFIQTNSCHPARQVGFH
jgi:hypothetical protein